MEKLRSGKIDIAEAGVAGKLCESVVSTIKTQLEYARMCGKQPSIPFLGDISKNKNMIEQRNSVNLLDKK